MLMKDFVHLRLRGGDSGEGQFSGEDDVIKPLSPQPTQSVGELDVVIAVLVKFFCSYWMSRSLSFAEVRENILLSFLYNFDILYLITTYKFQKSRKIFKNI